METQPDPPLLRRQGDFIRLLAARIGSGVASQMLMVALGWQMYDLTGSAWDLGLVGLAQFAPALLFALPAGHWVDQHDRRRLLLLSLSLPTLTAAVLALASAYALVTPALILGLSMLLGAARAMQMPAQQALLPSLVPSALLPRAVAAASAALQASVVAGPALGGLLYATASRGLDEAHAGMRGAAAAYGASALLFVVAILAIWRIRRRPQVGGSSQRDWNSLTAGLRFIWRHPVLLGAISLDLFAVLLGGATALLPIFARDVLDVGPEGLGAMRSAPAVGALVVALWLARHPLQRGVGTRLLLAVAIYGLAMIGFALVRSLPMALAMLALSGAADMVSVVIRQSLVQLETPDAMRGRVGAVNSVFIGASNQLGEFESGATAAWLGPVGSVLAGGFGTLLVVAIWAQRFPALRRRESLQSLAPP